MICRNTLQALLWLNWSQTNVRDEFVYIIMSYLNCAFSTLQLRASNMQVMCFINPRGRHRTRPYNKTQYTRITLMRLTAQSKLTLATQSVQIYPGVHKPFHTHPHGHTRTKRHTQKTQTHTNPHTKLSSKHFCHSCLDTSTHHWELLCLPTSPSIVLGKPSCSVLRHLKWVTSSMKSSLIISRLFLSVIHSLILYL